MAERWPVIGRDGDCAAIMMGLRNGTGTVIVGEAGVGKSTLARRVAGQLRAEGWRVALVLSGGRADLTSPVVRELAHADAVRTLLVVNDAHQLDVDSAGLLWRLAAGERVGIVATARAGVHLREQIARLWTSGACGRLDLAPLTDVDIRRLITDVLGGDVDDRIVQTIAKQAAGNALLVREVLRCGVDTGAIRRSHQLWWLAGKRPLGRPVADVISASCWPSRACAGRS